MAIKQRYGGVPLFGALFGTPEGTEVRKEASTRMEMKLAAQLALGTRVTWKLEALTD